MKAANGLPPRLHTTMLSREAPRKQFGKSDRGLPDHSAPDSAHPNTPPRGDFWLRVHLRSYRALTELSEHKSD